MRVRMEASDKTIKTRQAFDLPNISVTPAEDLIQLSQIQLSQLARWGISATLTKRAV